NVVKSKIDYKGAILIMSTLSLSLIFLMEGGQSWPWISWHSLVFIILIAVLIKWTYNVEKNNPNAIIPLWIWKNKTIGFTSLAMVGMGINVMGPETFIPIPTIARLVKPMVLFFHIHRGIIAFGL